MRADAYCRVVLRADGIGHYGVRELSVWLSVLAPLEDKVQAPLDVPLEDEVQAPLDEKLKAL